jgi:hypothetical protein
MGTAFSSSLLGLAGSLVVGLLELFASHGQNRFYGELEDWLSSFTRLSIAEAEGDGDGSRAMVAALAEHLEEQADFFQQIRDRSATDRVQVDEGLAKLAGAIDALAARLDSGMGATSDTFQRLADGQDRLAAIMAGAAGGEHGSAAGDAESRMRLRSIDTQMLRLLEEVAAGRQEALGDLRADLAQLTRVVRAFGQRSDPPSPFQSDGRG